MPQALLPSKLTALGLANCGLGVASVKLVAAALQCCGVRHMDLSGNALSGTRYFSSSYNNHTTLCSHHH